jgi:hypothetical protein
MTSGILLEKFLFAVDCAELSKQSREQIESVDISLHFKFSSPLVTDEKAGRKKTEMKRHKGIWKGDF